MAGHFLLGESTNTKNARKPGVFVKLKVKVKEKAGVALCGYPTLRWRTLRCAVERNRVLRLGAGGRAASLFMRS
jgi:hypothetical protein